MEQTGLRTTRGGVQPLVQKTTRVPMYLRSTWNDSPRESNFSKLSTFQRNGFLVKISICCEVPRGTIRKLNLSNGGRPSRRFREELVPRETFWDPELTPFKDK